MLSFLLRCGASSSTLSISSAPSSLASFGSPNPSCSKTQLHKKKLKEKFEEFDQDKSGFISVQELQRGFLTEEFPEDIVELLVERFDKNKDGKIDVKEFSELYNFATEVRLSFEYCDRDKDKKISLGELQQLFNQSAQFHDCLDNNENSLQDLKKSNSEWASDSKKIDLKNVQRFLNIFDANYNGKLEFSEYARALAYFREISYLFETADRDQSETLQKEELRKILSKMAKFVELEESALLYIVNKKDFSDLSFNQFLEHILDLRATSSRIKASPRKH